MESRGMFCQLGWENGNVSSTYLMWPHPATGDAGRCSPAACPGGMNMVGGNKHPTIFTIVGVYVLVGAHRAGGVSGRPQLNGSRRPNELLPPLLDL